MRTAKPLFNEGLFVFNGEFNVSRREPGDLKESFLLSFLKLFLVLVIARFTGVLVSEDLYIPRSSTKSCKNRSLDDLPSRGIS